MKKMKLRIKEKLNMIGYASGSMIRVYENFAGFYLIFYLTSIAGLRADTAGTIQSVIGICGALLSPILGMIVDRFGDKRKIFKTALIPAALIPCLLFVSPKLAGGWNVLYYIITGCLMTLTYYSTVFKLEI